MKEALESIPIGAIVPFIVLNVILIVVALIDLFRSEQTRGPRWMWILIIVFLQLVGPVSYFIVGRRREA
ncbi:PLD nuclease N-terminal domain-containing protein [Paenibacillus daejeonensis]|uniref:PLD nuclease N-terminal domain-containing protein n=1 Tax=Paenibacillus daejeonensis TaxID=135193 RepID=UPI000364DB58|nr:PLD nuclease N-terminal domain-containing protein [Paenibacillus daejeonensis]